MLATFQVITKKDQKWSNLSLLKHNNLTFLFYCQVKASKQQGLSDKGGKIF